MKNLAALRLVSLLVSVFVLACIALWFRALLNKTTEQCCDDDALPLSIPSPSPPSANTSQSISVPSNSRKLGGVVPQSTEEWISSRFLESRELSRRENPADARGEFERERLLGSDFKYPLIRVVERFERDPSNGEERLLTRTAMVADHVLVSIKDESTAELVRAKIDQEGGRILKSVNNGRLQVVQLPSSDLDAVNHGVTALSRHQELIAYVEPDYLFFGQAVPTDPGFSNQWGLQNSSSPELDISAAEGWDVRTSAADVIVAVIDSGVRCTHEDLSDSMWRNSKEIPGNGIDDDQDGFIDDVYGVDFYNDDANPDDDFGHGSHVAGIIGARANNGVGIAGVAWQAKLMAVKFLSATGTGAASDAVEAIDYAIAKGAHILNNSWGGDSFSQALYDAIARAAVAGIPFVAAAGNEGRNIDTTPKYPACYDLDNIVSVTAMDRSGWRSGNWGRQSVDVFAPGVSIYSCVNGTDNNYSYKTGSSQAAAFVSGVLALLKAEFPAQAYSWLLDRFYKATVSHPNLYLNNSYVWTDGRADLYNTLIGTVRPPVSIATQPAPLPAYSGAALTLSVSVQGGAPFRYQWYRDGEPLTGQINASLALPGLSQANNGAYHVVVTNLTGSVTSQVVDVAVIDSAPVITKHPASLPALAGQKVTIDAAVTGSLPQTWQWEFNGSPLAGQTGSQLDLSNFKAENAGAYRLVATNAFGTQATSVAQVELRTHYLERWTQTHPVPSSGNYTNVVFAGGKFIAVGKAGLIASSDDGEMWQLATSGTSADLTAAAFGNGRYVAVGSGGVIVSSTDAVSWTPANSGLLADIPDVCFGAGCFLAISGNSALISTDGTEWTSQFVSNKSLVRVAYGGGNFVAIGDDVGYNLYTYRSADATNWIAGSPFTVNSYYLIETSLLYQDGGFMLSDGSRVYTSTDGGFWQLYGYMSNQKRLESAPDFIYLLNSFNLSSFNKATLQTQTLFNYYPTYSLTGLAYGNGKVVAVGSGGVIFLSRNGTSFNLVSHITTSGFVGIANANGGFVGATSEGKIISSPDGTQWSLRTTLNLELGQYLNSLAYGNGRFVAGSNSAWISTDGFSWQEQPTTQAAASFQGSYFWKSDGSESTYRSTDGLNWTKLAVYSAGGLCYGGGKYLALDRSYGKSSVSIDGISWQQGSLPPSVGTPSALIWGDGRFVALTTWGYLLTSHDGLAWQSQQPSGLTGWPNGLIFQDGLYAAATDDGIFVSLDAVNWAIRRTGRHLDFISGATDVVVRAGAQLNTLVHTARVANVSVDVAGEGSVQIEPRAASYLPGDTVTLRAKANPGYVFAGWGGSYSRAANPLVLQTGSDIAVRARFKPFSLLWRQTHFTLAEITGGLSEAGLDADGDGMDNYTEYRLGLNPRSADRVNYPSSGISSDLDGQHLTFTYRRQQSDATLRYLVESSEDCSQWSPAQATVAGLVDNGDGTETVTVRETDTTAGRPRGFLRLRVEEQ